MLEWIEQAVATLGYGGIVLLMALENLFPPVPSEVIMPLAGWSARSGDLTLVGVVAAGTAGSVLGALALYGLGAGLGEARLRRWTARHGHWLLLTQDDLDRAAGWFRRHGSATVLIGRLVPGVRSLVSIPAGLGRMPLGLFVPLTAVGTGLWAGLLAWLGRELGRNYAVLGKYMSPAATVILAGLLIACLARALRLRRRRRSRPS